MISPPEAEGQRAGMGLGTGLASAFSILPCLAWGCIGIMENEMENYYMIIGYTLGLYWLGVRLHVSPG